MSSFFQYYYPEAEFNKEETQVLCPYPHHTVSGIVYKESNPSAGVNLDKGVFHCLRCGASKSTISFIKDVYGCSYEQANKLKEAFEKDEEDIFTWTSRTQLSDEVREKLHALKITDQVIEELNIRSEHENTISFPVTLHGKILDIRNYNPGNKPKVKSNYGAISGLIIPYDIWTTTPESKWTVVCAGEKDMAIARSNGFNAITITGGEMTEPILLEAFRNRRVAIFYDNDDAGKLGARKLAALLKPVVAVVKNVTAFHDVCKEKGEDIHDFFTKYNGTSEQLKEYIKKTEAFTDEDMEQVIEQLYPTITLREASTPKYINKTVRTNIQVVATFESSFVVPTSITGVKEVYSSDQKHTSMKYMEKREWALTENTLKDVLHLVDNNFTETDIKKNIRGILNIPIKEEGVRITKSTKETVFKCSVTDLFESTEKDTVQMEYTAYSIGKKLESGKKYKATYQLVPHPYKGQQLIMIIQDVNDAADTVSSFKITEETIEQLKAFQQIEGNVTEKVYEISERVKGLIAFDANSTLIQAIDLAFHTVLNFDFGRFKDVRGYLDTLIVSESRVGKSSISEALQKTYNLGVFASLAGNSATMPGLIGGSNKTGNGSFQTRAGLIPQNHRGLIVFEELAKCNANIIRELTDIKSSNEVRITRVNGTLKLPALTRMITLTNVKALNGVNRAISSYPNGIEIVSELIGTAEDIARFDVMLVLAHPGNREIDPFWKPKEPFSETNYRTRIRWVWSRETSQIHISEETTKYIIKRCNELNNKYDSHIKIFGTEAWKKVTRLAIAVAGYIVSTDETYENIVVTKECVDYAVNFYTAIYDNSTFKLAQYVNRERMYSEIDEEGIARLEELYVSHTALLNQLEQSSVCSRNELMAATGLVQDEFNKTINNLVQGMFVRFQGQTIIPTERFRKGMSSINRNSSMKRVGEPAQHTNTISFDDL